MRREPVRIGVTERKYVQRPGTGIPISGARLSVKERSQIKILALTRSGQRPALLNQRHRKVGTIPKRYR